MPTQAFTVTGMTCGHCQQAVTKEISALAGVSRVEVDLATGLVTVDSDRTLTRDELAEAVDEAGYELAF